MDNRSIEEAKSYHQITKRTPADGAKARKPTGQAKVYTDAAVSPAAERSVRGG